MKSLNRTIAPALALCAAVLAGCAAAPSKVDPLEPWNRTMYSVHTAVDDAVIKPVAKTYVEVWPEPVRTAVSNFFGNIDDIFTGINDALQGDGNRAGDAFGRVLLNSTFGLAGIFDLASMMGITKDHNDFGLTFGAFTLPEMFRPAMKSRLAWPAAFAAVAAMRVRIQSPPGIFLICLTRTPARKLKTTTMRRWT